MCHKCQLLALPEYNAHTYIDLPTRAYPNHKVHEGLPAVVRRTSKFQRTGATCKGLRRELRRRFGHQTLMRPGLPMMISRRMVQSKFFWIKIFKLFFFWCVCVCVCVCVCFLWLNKLRHPWQRIDARCAKLASMQTCGRCVW